MAEEKLNSQKVLIVAMCKITSSFDDIIEIEEEKIFKGNVKKSVRKFQSWYDGFSRKILSLYYEKNAKYFEETVDFFNKYEDNYDLGSESCTRMALIHGKLSSAQKDLERVTFDKEINRDTDDEVIFAALIVIEIKKLLKNGFWNQFTSMTDVNGANTEALIKSLDDQGSFLYL